MDSLLHRHRPTPTQLGRQFQLRTGLKPPTESKIYRNGTPSPVCAVPEFAPMGGVLISYPGTIAPGANLEQLAPSGPRAFGIPNELIVRMQQNDTTHPVHIFVLCQDLTQRDAIEHNLEQTARKLSLMFNPDLLHVIPWDTDTFWTRD